MSNTEAKPIVRPVVDIAEPPMFRVIYMNDDKTPMDFVISSLIDHFSYSVMDAESITMAIHDQGSAVVAVLPYEIAEQKGVEVTVIARTEGYPLQIKLEPVGG